MHLVTDSSDSDSSDSGADRPTRLARDQEESGLSLVADSSDSDSSPDTGAGRPMRLAKDQEESGLRLDVDIKKRLRKENRFLQCFES